MTEPDTCDRCEGRGYLVDEYGDDINGHIRVNGAPCPDCNMEAPMEPTDTTNECGAYVKTGDEIYGPCIRPPRHKDLLPHTDDAGRSWWYDSDRALFRPVQREDQR